jgi:hypothetical protein
LSAALRDFPLLRSRPRAATSFTTIAQAAAITPSEPDAIGERDWRRLPGVEQSDRGVDVVNHELAEHVARPMPS